LKAAEGGNGRVPTTMRFGIATRVNAGIFAVTSGFSAHAFRAALLAVALYRLVWLQIERAGGDKQVASPWLTTRFGLV
jgi:hypothetical protein